MSKELISINEHLSKIYEDFEESTLISPNKSREKEKDIITKLEYEIKKENLVGFINSNSISINELLLASLTLTLNKFNFSYETLIFNQNNDPFATKFENRKISIKEFLENIHEIYNETLEFNEYIDEDALLLKPEFYYSFDEDLNSDIDYSNYLSIVESDKTVLLSLFYNSELYTKDFINLFLSSIENIINQFVNIDVDKTNIEDIALVSEKENIEFTEVEMPLLHKRFEEQVKANPDNIALVAEDATFTADELNQKANKIANALIKKGVKPKSNVLVMLHRNSDLIASILGILKAGCTYIPIDLEYPKDRINYIYENSQADYIISDEDKENSLNIKELLKEENTENPDVEITPDDLAYMIYTSGSTGNPKGVMISHENICNEVQNPKSEYNSLLCITTISFDVAMDDIFTALANGIKLIFANDTQIKNIPKLTELINEHEPEVADFTPSRMASHLEVEEFCKAISCLKCLFLGGEQFSTKVYEDFRKYSNAIVYNSYGPTETTITSNNKEITDINDITVGFPLDNYITDVRDIDGKLVPNGVMGELYIGGTGVGKGYYNMPEKTEEVFLTINDIPYYRSGDYAIELPNGEIDIKGRIDNQIKLRGLRIEIGEIETNISQYPNIKQAVVVIKEINNNDHLCAYYTADEEIDSNDLKEYLKEKLTRYMVPTVFMQLDEMPQTPNGKTDLKKLPEPQLRLTLTLPETETEIRLHEIASSISKTKEFGTTDDLYAIGFTSLTLMKLNAKIYDEMGVNLDIIALLNDPTIKNIANEIENNDLLDLESIIELSNDTEYYPLTENQMGIYYECIQSGDVAQYNLPSVIRFSSEIDANRLKEAIIKTIEVYPYLKTRIVLEKSKVMLKRDDSIAIDNIPIVSVEEISDDEIEKENLKPFDLHNDQLFRFKIYKTPTETILFSDVHHIISDGESLDKLFTNIANAYQGIEIEKEEIDGYINSLIENENENSEKYESSRKFFQDRLSQEVDSTVLTPNLNGNYEDGILKSISKNINPELISEFCNVNRITLNVLFMATTMLNLNKYTFTDKTLITTIFNGRSNSLYNNTQTLLVKTLPIVSINDDRTLTIKEYLKSINDIWMETISHSDYPYTKISEEFKLKPEFFYAYNNLDAEEIEIDDEVYKVKYLNSLEVNYKISLDVNETKDNIELFIQYNDQLYSADYIETFLNSIVNVINQLIEADIEKLSIGEIELSENKEIPTFDPIDTPILHKRFEKQVAENPDNIALVASDATLTYKQLNERSNRIANSLIEKGVKPGSNVLVMLPRNSNLIATIIGIFKAGCTFIPIDLEYPAERIKYIYENSEADYIINTEGTTKNTLDINELIMEENVANPNVEVTSDDLAYMIYTSGSTGKPKGVMISHENACNEAAENPKCKYSSILSIATIAFDTSLEDILTGITNGIKIIFANDNEIKNVVDLTKLIKENQPEVMEFTPSRLLSYLEIEEFCNAIGCGKCIVMGGEQFSAKAFNGVKQYTNAKIYNSYGPTEATIASNYKEITDPENITVGKALKNYVTEVRDLDGKLLPKGVMGELYIGGIGVGKGYYNMPEKTAEVYTTINNIPYYRSGDYAIELPNGEIDIKGRIDNQIKLRGLRIEIGEIESNINRFPNIKRTVVVIKEINNNDHLCAYFTSDEKIDIRLLKRYLNNKLTKYMVPTVFMQLDEIPHLPNGKTDLKKLPTPKLDLENVKPKNETEEKVFEIVSGMIDSSEFGTTDDLYALGFTSLTLMKLNSLIYNETNANIDIASLFNNPTVQSLAYEIDNNIELDIDIDEIIESAKDIEYFPLTSNQLGIYYECMQSEKIKYTMPIAVRFDNSIEPDNLKEALIKTIEAHPYLKTRIINTDDGKIMQKRCDGAEIDEIEIVEIDAITNKEIMKNDIKAIPLDNNQLFRFKIYKTAEETILFSDFHHIITDGVSQDNFFNDLTKAFNSEKIETEKIDGFVYSLIENQTAISESSEKFFKSQFSQGIESTVLTPNLNGNPEIGDIKLISDNVDSTFVRHFCNDYSISPNVLFMTATILTLNKFTFNSKSLITTIFNGRANSDYFDTQGMLVKTLPIIVNGENREMMVEDYIKIVDKAWKDALTHSNYPYTKLAEDYQLKPEFFYAFHKSFDDEIILNGKKYKTTDLDGTVATDYKINLDVFDDGENISLYIEYNDQIYTEEYVKLFLQAIKYTLFQFFVNDMDKLRIKDIELVNGEIPEFEELDTPFLHKRFEKQVEEKGNEIALVATDETLTYDELNQKANRIANELIKKGVKPKSNVLVMLPRNSDLIATIIGIFKAGCTFVPIDLEYPQERIDYIYENSQADYIINTSGESDNSIDIKELIKGENITNPDVNISPYDLAYMIYTSGSTGNPKGVMISHENACNEAAENPKCEYSSILSIATIAFDTSLEDILTGITNGIKIIFADDIEIKNIVDLIRLIKENQPEVMEFTPSRLLSYLEIEEFCEVIGCGKCIVMGGEQFSAKAFNGVKQYTNAKVYNSYGPTEATIASNYKEITDPENITVGKALKNYVTEVRDLDGKLLPKGVMGELYIGGIGVGKGYYNMPEKTAEVYTTINDIPYYRSGDYAIELPNGEIDIKGRIDNQIKLRGLRIEIGEVESNISDFPEIKQVIVIIKKINNSEHLCAYYTAGTEIDKDQLKKYLTERLTKYMVPTVFMQLDEMPQLPNGKTDTKKLPEPKAEINYVAPETPLEQEICAIFSNVLNVEIVGAEDNFFEIGGTSLVASKLIIELLKQDHSVKYDDIFHNQTPRKLAKFLSGEVEIEYDGIQLIKNYNYDEINKLLEENTLDSFLEGEKIELGNVLLTGATGFLGIHVLYEFIKNESGTIYCMFRKGKFDSCEERLIDLMNYYFDEDFSDLIGSRIILSEGDITNLDDFKKLENCPIDTIINCAAIVKHYTADDYIFKVNVDGVINGLKFAESRNNVTYVQISTISVLSSFSENEEAYPDMTYNERTLYYEQDLTNKYLGSKFLAERMVLEAATRGLPVKIIRVGNLMSRHDDGVFQKNYETNAFLNNIKVFKNIHAITPIMSKEEIDMSQIDYVAKSVLELSKTPEKCRIFHSMNDQYISNGDIIDALNDYGYDIREVNNEEFKEIYEKNMNENIQGLITAEISVEDYEEEDSFEDLVEIEQTTEILHSLGFYWPKPDKDYLKRLIDYLNKFDYFE